MSPNRARLVFIKSEPRQAFGGVTPQRVQHLTHVVRYLVVGSRLTPTVFGVAFLKRHTIAVLFRPTKDDLQHLQEPKRASQPDAHALHGRNRAIRVILAHFKNRLPGLHQRAGYLKLRRPLLDAGNRLGVHPERN